MPVDTSPEARARALAKCAEVDRKWDDYLGPEGRQKMAEVHEQIARSARQDQYEDRTKPSRRKKPTSNT